MSQAPDREARARGKKVLVVDDDPDVRMLVTMLLEDKGFSVVGQAPDGKDGVLGSFEDQPDFVILDYMMPNVSGADAASFMRATCPGVHIVAFSGVSLKDPQWADDYLAKDDVARLPALLERLVAERAA